MRQRPDDFPPELLDSAASLESVAGVTVSRSGLAGAVVEQIKRILKHPPSSITGTVADEMAERDVLVGRTVRVGDGLGGVAAGIDPDGRLRLRTEAGEVITVLAGPVSGDEGYQDRNGRR